MKKRILAAAAAMVLAGLLGGCFGYDFMEPVDEANMKLVQLDPPKDGQDMAVIKTNLGEIKMILYPEYAPNICANFKARVEEGYYNNKKVFGVIKDAAFLVGANDDTGKEGKTSDGKLIESEYHDNLWHFAGAVSAFSDKKNKVDSRFFINTDLAVEDDMVEQMKSANYPEAVIKAFQEKGGVPAFTRYYPVFGQVIEGLDIVKEISSYASDDENDQRPTKDVMIESITLTQYQAPAESSAASTANSAAESAVESKQE